MTQKEKTTDIVQSAGKRIEVMAETIDDKELSFTDFLLGRYCFDTEIAGVTRFSSQHELVIMQFCLQGEYFFKSKKSLAFKSSEYNILFVPKGELEFIYPAGITPDFINIYMEKDFFFRHIPQEHSFYRLKNAATFSAVSTDNLYLTPKLKSILNEIDTCGFDGHLKTLYTKAKIIEMIALQLAQYEEAKTAPSGLKQSEAEKMYLVKDLIDSNPYESYTLAYLARVAGTNEQYLKKHFKILFGSTVFGYILSCRMQQAKDMILSGEYRISDIAEITGYKHATHFTNAFKKFFGYLPQTLKPKNVLGLFFSLSKLQLLEMCLYL